MQRPGLCLAAIRAGCLLKLEDSMKRVALLLSIVFIILTFSGAGYVLFNQGRVNAGYAVVPMIFALASISFYRQSK